MKLAAGRPQLFLLVLLLLTASATVSAPVINRVAATPAPNPPNPVYVEDSPAAQNLIDRAAELQRQNRSREAVATYQKAIDEYAHKLMPIPGGRYTDVVVRVRTMLLSDADLLETYRRVHEPMAEGALAQAGAGGGETGKLDRIVLRFGLCRAGLDAALLLAGRYLERADASSAATVLDDVVNHPDIELRQARWHVLQALAGVYEPDDRRLSHHREALAAMGALDDVARVDRVAADRRRPPRTEVFDAMSTLPAVTVIKPLSEPLWHVNVPTPPPQIAAVLNQIRKAKKGGQVPKPSRFLYMIPTVHEDRLYVNDGGSVLALDRNAGRVMWISHSDVTLGRPNTRIPQTSLDQRGVAVVDHRVLAVLGYYPWPARRGRQKMRQTWVACLRKSDGTRIWEVHPGDADPALANASFHGTPLVLAGRVFVLARRMHNSNFQDAYLVALDLADGRMLYKRHLSSAMSRHHQFVESFAQIVADGGRLYVTDNLGAVCCFDARDGTARWVTIVNQGLSGLSHNAAGDIGRQVSLPVRVKAGLVVRPRGAGGAAVLIDPDTGIQKKDLTEPAFREALYLARAGADLLCVGSTLVLFDGETLQPRWRRPLHKQTALGRPMGRSCVSTDRVIVPIKGQIVVVSLADGKIVAEYPISETGNLLVLDGEIIVTGMTSVRSYLSWSVAYSRLRKQMAARPTDPAPAMALAHLAWSSSRDDDVLESVDAALAALEQRQTRQTDDGVSRALVDPVQQKVFRQLLGFTQSRRKADRALRSALYARLASVTATPGDEVAYRLANGEFLGDTGEHRGAIDVYQSILDDTTLSVQIHTTDDGALQAGLEAAFRQSALIEEHGRGFYAHIDQKAGHLLAELEGAEAAMPDELLEMARRFINARCAVSALVVAAERLAADGKTEAAVVQLRRAYRMNGDPTVVPRIVGGLVELNLAANRIHRAHYWLERTTREHEKLTISRRGELVSPAAWLDDLRDLPAVVAHLPSFELPMGDTTVLQGRLRVPQLQPRGAWLRDRIITQDGAQVQLRRVPHLDQVSWSVSIPPGRSARVLVLTAEQVLLWMESAGTIVALDGDTGTTQWRHDDLDAVMGEVVPPVAAGTGLPDQVVAQWWRQPQPAVPQKVIVGRPRIVLHQVEGRAAAVRNVEGRIGLKPRPAPTDGIGHLGGFLFGLNGTSLAVAAADGHIIVIDRNSGQIRWRRRVSISRLTHLVMDGETLALAATRDSKGVIITIDPNTGKIIVPAVETERPVTWIGVNNEQTMWYITGQHVVAHSLVDRLIRWSRPIPDQTFLRGAKLDLGVLLLGLRNGEPLTLEASTGRTIEQRRAAVLDSQRPIQARSVEGRWHVLGPAAAMALSGEGRIEWVDAIADVEKQLLDHWVGDRYVVLLNQVEPLAVARVNVRHLMRQGPNVLLPRVEDRVVQPDRWVYCLYLLDRVSGVIVHQQDLEALKAAVIGRESVLLDDHLVLSTESFTIIIPARGADRERVEGERHEGT